LRTASLASLGLVTAIGALAPAALHAQNDAPDLELGRRQFIAHCSRCHGIAGEGSEGPPLAVAQLFRASTFEILGEVVRNGIPGTGMPGSRFLSQGHVDAIAAYVLSLGRNQVAEELRGDAENGAELFQGAAKCGGCHVVEGRGTSLGPELSDVGLRRGSIYLRKHVLNPREDVSEDYLMLRVETRSGETVQGIRVNEDAFTVQLRDEDNEFHSFDKEDLVSLSRLPGVTFMPSYRAKLDESQIDDLIAYLAGLKARR